MPEIVSNSIQAHIARFNPESNVYEHLILQRAESQPIFPNLWQTITGWIENNETAFNAAKREIFEESGLIPFEYYHIPHIASFYIPTKDLISLAPIFGALADYNAQVTISFEHQNYMWLDKKSALAILQIPSHRKAIKLFDKMLNENNQIFKINL